MPRYATRKSRVVKPDLKFAARINDLIHIYRGQIPLANAIGTSQANVSRWAKGRGATIESLRLITRSLNLSADKMIGDVNIEDDDQVIGGVSLAIVKQRLREVQKVETWKELSPEDKLCIVAIGYSRPLREIQRFVTLELLERMRQP